MNTFFAPAGSKTDYSYAIDQLQAQHRECTTVSLVCAWFFNSEDASACQIYPSTNYLLGGFERVVGGASVADHWRVSGLTEQDYPGIIPLPALPGTANFAYGGTPSDPSIVRCIRDLKARGLRVVFYPFLLGTGSGFPWRGRIGYPNDVSSAASAAVSAFLGSASTGQFSRDTVNLTVSYSGGLYDWTYRRMILHYANLCVIAGGVDLFVIGSELRGLETIRGPGLDQGGNGRRLGKGGLGLSVRRRPRDAGERRPERLRRRGPDQGPDRAREPHHLFGRLVVLDGLSAPGAKTASGRTSISSGRLRISTSSVSIIICR